MKSAGEFEMIHRIILWGSAILMAGLFGLFPVTAHGAPPPDDDMIHIVPTGYIGPADMAGERGMGSTDVTVTATQNLAATSSNNTVNIGGSLTTGSINAGGNLGGGGFGSIVMNSGNNATINSGVNVSVLMLH